MTVTRFRLQVQNEAECLRAVLKHGKALQRSDAHEGEAVSGACLTRCAVHQPLEQIRRPHLATLECDLQPVEFESSLCNRHSDTPADTTAR